VVREIGIVFQADNRKRAGHFNAVARRTSTLPIATRSPYFLIGRSRWPAMDLKLLKYRIYRNIIAKSKILISA
jgi:hypothetical protein